MIDIFSTILNSKTKIWHFLLVFIISTLTCFLSYILLIPIIYWGAYGEGAESARIEALPINVFIGEWGAIIFIILTLIILMGINLKKHKIERTKSFLLTLFIIVPLYFFRNPIIDLLIELEIF
ncbi:hypothetical protein [Pedobacter sp. N23S346]|uniref:hypothetical protein n=1 Tax=Pedobacter sp. N23S346 TaxID=3402750 RepID=UPI003AC75051